MPDWMLKGTWMSERKEGGHRYMLKYKDEDEGRYSTYFCTVYLHRCITSRKEKKELSAMRRKIDYYFSPVYLEIEKI